ncbi:UBN2_3 domain-containing protein [Cephalotus follicularis]|uniref:UBN2_3 domain-containing protein n=1 Tax=Cephalotus follicularis TaxID=3775 RepID=A0A1Q3BQZ2_CEPFO|nr:UBN2_3 domain-containing protein [Cephalotus follicularis]
MSDATSGQASTSHGGPESLVQPITVNRLNRQNYPQWSQSVMMFISGKGKDDYLTGAAAPPPKGDPKFKSWRAENNMVMSWLINSMDNEIGQNFLFYGSAKEIWDAAKEPYADNENTAEFFEIKCVLHDIREGDLTVTQYYNTLSRYWQQLDRFEKSDWECPGDHLKYRKIMEKERIVKFLVGFNKNLDVVRGRIFDTKPLPPLREAFSEVRREESRKKVMMGGQGAPTIPESSALMSRRTIFTNDKQRNGKPWCDHCRKPGHTKETCWKLHGKPADWKPKNERDHDSQGFTITAQEPPQSSPELHSFSTEQIDLLQSMLSQLQSSSSSKTIESGLVAQKGMFSNALSVKAEKFKSWIVDSGASDHMTGNATLFNSYSPCSENYRVRIVDGTLSNVAGIGTIMVSKDIILNSILFVPKLTCNLLSISKFTRDCN